MNTDWLKDKLDQRGLTQADLARAFGVDPSAISRLMKGDRGISVQEVRKLADLLGIAVAEVMLDGDTMRDSTEIHRKARVDEAVSAIEAAFGEGSVAKRRDAKNLGDLRPAARERKSPAQTHFGFTPEIPLYGQGKGYLSNALTFEGGPIRYVRRPPQLEGATDGYAAFVVNREMEPRYILGEKIFVDPSQLRAAGVYAVVWFNEESKDGRFKGGKIYHIEEINDEGVRVKILSPEVELFLPHSIVDDMHPIIGTFVI